MQPMYYEYRYRDYDAQWRPYAPPVLPTWHEWFAWTPKWDGWEEAEQHNGRAWIAYRRRLSATSVGSERMIS